ncbi:hypothetical protein Prudu_1378S000100 [Prunus dulcis]|uniref:Uncharacterized protein n=1 Tax=Prunus dulcis TaxID=3755 RepID=A0A5H2Y830_PRUDU|nr:hypothetical protein Prudu_1378S000100 [Prunus dulcis]
MELMRYLVLCVMPRQCVTSEGTLRRLAASESAQKSCENKKIEKKAKTTETGRPKSTTSKIWAYEVFPALAALDLVVHKDNAYIPLSTLEEQYFAVDVQLLRPSVIDKQQLYWTWGDSVDDTEELVELFGDDAEKKPALLPLRRKR